MQILSLTKGTGHEVITVVSIEGDVYPEHMPQFMEQLKKTAEDIDPRRVILNLSNVKFLPSLALGQLVAFQKALKTRGGAVKICGMTPNIAKIFKLTKFDSLFEIFATEDEAVVGFTGT